MDDFIGTFWAIVPVFVSITFALITKDIYISLFFGIVFGGLLYTKFSILETLHYVVQGCLINVLSDPFNVGVIIFLVSVGVLVSMIKKSGGTQAFCNFSQKYIKNKAGVLVTTWLLGIFLFIDDYFNSLTVGNVIKPLSDKYKISRAKLAYIIDSTAAPACIISPISSWAAAMTGFMNDPNGFSIFLHTIPYNYYALLTIVMVLTTSLLGVDFKKMRRQEYSISETNEGIQQSSKGSIGNLFIPILLLYSFCVFGLLYSGGFLENYDIFLSLSKSDSSIALSMGGVMTLIASTLYYTLSGSIKFSECMNSITDGFKNMVSAILILVLAWSLKKTVDSLGVNTFICNTVGDSFGEYVIIIPFIVFILAAIISFSTGTSWGTSSILIPVVMTLFKATDPQLMIIAVSAVMAGAVLGDHTSPISDTSIMSSSSAGCNHITHIATQLPYALTVGIVSLVCYLIATVIREPFIPLLIGMGIIFTIVKILSLKNRNKY